MAWQALGWAGVVFLLQGVKVQGTEDKVGMV
jgi:hypothetical protein